MNYLHVLIILIAMFFSYRCMNYTEQNQEEHDIVNVSLSKDKIIKYDKIKMNMQRYYTALEENKQTPETSDSLMKKHKLMGNYNDEKLMQGTESLYIPKYNGSELAELPIINQNMCGSCWAVSCSMALKANLNLKEYGMKTNEVPNLNYMIACSDKPYQLVNVRNRDTKWIIELSNTRGINAGCEGGITGMGLSMLQLHKEIIVDDISRYKSGDTGDLSKGHVTRETRYNLPELSCAEARAQGANQTLPKFPLSLTKLDTTHLFRRDSQYGVYFPYTRDIREFIYKHKAVIVFVDMDSGLQTTDLYKKKEVVRLPSCQWKRADYMQSGKTDMNAMSQFKEADHALLLVGWDCSRKAWLLHNSWGSDWGDNGMLWVYDPNVCSKEFVHSGHSWGAGPACMFGSSMSVFTI